MESPLPGGRQEDLPHQHHGSASDFHLPLLHVRKRRASAAQHADGQPSSGGRTHAPTPRSSSDSPMWKAVCAAAKAARSLQESSRFQTHASASKASRNNSSASTPCDSTQLLLHSKIPASRYPRMSRVMSWSLLGQAQATAKGRPQHRSMGGSLSEGQLLLELQRESRGACGGREDGKASRGSKSCSGCSAELKQREWVAASKAAVSVQQQQQQHLLGSASSRVGEPRSQADQTALSATEHRFAAGSAPPKPQPSAPCSHAGQLPAPTTPSSTLHQTPKASDAQDHTHSIPSLAQPPQHQHQPHPPPGPPRKCLRSFGFQFSLDGHSRGSPQGSNRKTHLAVQRGASTTECFALECSSPLPQASPSSISTPGVRTLSTPSLLWSSSSSSQAASGQQQQQQQLLQQQSWEHHCQDLLQPRLPCMTGMRRGYCSAISASMTSTSSAPAAAKTGAVGGARFGSRRSMDMPKWGVRRSMDMPVHENGEVMRLGPRTSALLRSQ